MKEKHQNKVELLGHYGGDLSHAQSAWTSTVRNIDEAKMNRMPALLKMLAENHHETPFEKSSLHFLVTTEVASHVQILKHRIGVSCLAGDTKIYIPVPGGGVKKITLEELYERQEGGILSKSKNQKSYKRHDPRKLSVRTREDGSSLVTKSKINKVFYNGMRDVFEFTTSSGKSIRATFDHKFATPDGWQEIGKYLGVELTGSLATMKHPGPVATNGVRIEVPEYPYTFRSWWEQYENKYTRMEVASLTGMSYPNVKKWGYIFNITFKLDNNKDFKKDMIPWNYKKTGYTVNRKKHGLSSNINKNLSYKSWRASVGNWTRQQLPTLLEKFHHTCQAQLGECSRDFVCHHVVPVSVDPSIATNIENLALVCSSCHKFIHKTTANEISYAESFRKQDMKTVFSNRKPKTGRKLAFDYEDIIKVKYCGLQKVYDLEVDKTHCYVANGFLVHNCNGESARYKELKDDKYYVPQDWDDQEVNLYIEHMEGSLKSYHECLNRLVAKGVSRKRAKESARLYLPYGNQLTADVMFNFRSFAHFLGLRYSTHAQVEIREIARQMLEQVVNIEGDPFHHTLRAFKLVDENGKIREPFE